VLGRKLTPPPGKAGQGGGISAQYGGKPTLARAKAPTGMRREFSRIVREADLVLL
jgi:hypothetical protein